MSKKKLFQLNDIKSGESTGLTTEVNGTACMLLAVRMGYQIFVYINSCPHTGTPLDFHTGRFLSWDKKHILCSTHGALFKIEDGQCIAGPCCNSYLEAVPVTIEDGNVFTVL